MKEPFFEYFATINEGISFYSFCKKSNLKLTFDSFDPPCREINLISSFWMTLEVVMSICHSSLKSLMTGFGIKTLTFIYLVTLLPLLLNADKYTILLVNWAFKSINRLFLCIIFWDFCKLCIISLSLIMSEPGDMFCRSTSFMPRFSEDETSF